MSDFPLKCIQEPIYDWIILRNVADDDGVFDKHLRNISVKHDMSPADRCSFVEYARERRHDALLTEQEVSQIYVDADIQLDALIAAHDLIQAPMFKSRVDAQNARGDDVDGCRQMASGTAIFRRREIPAH